MPRPVRLQRLHAPKPPEPIETNLDDVDLDTIASIVCEHADGNAPDSREFVALDRGLNDLFEGAYELDALAVATRIGALSTRMYMVDLRDVAARVAEILSWAVAQNILSVDPERRRWTLKRDGVTFLPMANGCRDARVGGDAGAISIDGLVSRESKHRLRSRQKEKQFVISQADLLLGEIPDETDLPEAAARLLFPCTTVGELKGNLVGVTDGVELWQAVRVRWHIEWIHRQYLEQQDLADIGLSFN